MRALRFQRSARARRERRASSQTIKYNEGPAKLPLGRDGNGVPGSSDARGNSKMPWGREGTNTPPTEAMTASLQNLRTLIDYDEYQV